MQKTESSNTEETIVLVTGVSGFIAQHVVLALLTAGYRVRGTVRDLARARDLRTVFGPLAERLEFVQADLGCDADWPVAAAGCRFVQHLASPFPPQLPKNEDELIRPAEEGTRRVLRAAVESGVERVVVTSSIAAMMFGHPPEPSRIFNESDWSVAERCTPYPKSKTLAEMAAWEFVQARPRNARPELVTINPGLVLGPLLGQNSSTSAEMVRKLLRRAVPASVALSFPVVDVRDVAAAHVAAMTVPDAAGKRFLCAAETASMHQVATILHARFPERRIPTRVLPNWAARVFSYLDPTLGTIRDEIGRVMRFDNAQIRNVLGFAPRSLEDMVISMAESLIARGLV